MIQATILNKAYNIKNNWSDVTIKDMTKAQEYIDNMPKWLDNYIYKDSSTPVSEDKLLSFYVDWVEMFSDIPRDYLEAEINIEDPNDVSLNFLFGLVYKFLGEPNQDEIGVSNTIEFKGKKYTLIESVVTAGGVEKLLGGATYKHFAESQALVSLFQSKKYRKWSYLANVTAILFREDPKEKYEEEVISSRTEIFKYLPVSEVYKGYFFLHHHINKLQESILISLTVKKESLYTRLVKRLCSVLGGKFKRTK